MLTGRLFQNQAAVNLQVSPSGSPPLSSNHRSSKYLRAGWNRPQASCKPQSSKFEASTVKFWSEPEFVGEGWWLEKNLADWRWMNEGPCWQERVWDWGCAARGVGVWVWAGHLLLGTMVENVAIQRATPQGAVQAGMCAIAFSLPSSGSGERWYAGQRRIALMSNLGAEKNQARWK